MWCEYRVDTDGADDKLSDKSAESGDEVEHPKYTVRLVPLNISQLILKSFFAVKPQTTLLRYHVCIILLLFTAWRYA